MGYSIHADVVAANLKALYQYMEDNRLVDRLPAILAKINPPSMNASGRASMVDVSDNIRMIADHIDDPCLGLRLVASHDIVWSPVLKPLQPLLFQADQPRALNPVVCARMIERYFTIISEVTSVRCEIGKTSITFTLSENGDCVSHHQTDGVLVYIHKVFMLSTPVSLRRVEVKQCRPHKHADYYEQEFQRSPIFGSEKNRLIFEVSLNDMEDDIDYTTFISLNESRFLQNFPDRTFSEGCRYVIQQLLPLGEPTRERVCQVYHISLSTLKRRLKDEGVLFKDLVNDVRKTLVEAYISQGKMNFTEAAFQLGYKDMPQFSKAFKKWYGTSPSQYFSDQC